VETKEGEEENEKEENGKDVESSDKLADIPEKKIQNEDSESPAKKRKLES